MLSPVGLIFGRVAKIPKRFAGQWCGFGEIRDRKLRGSVQQCFRAVVQREVRVHPSALKPRLERLAISPPPRGREMRVPR